MYRISSSILVPRRNERAYATILTDNQLIHSVCDEPQVGEGSVPLVNRITHQTALVRLHGRNKYGWTKKDMTDQEWRDVRYLYNYNAEELQQLADKVTLLNQKSATCICRV